MRSQTGGQLAQVGAACCSVGSAVAGCHHLGCLVLLPLPSQEVEVKDDPKARTAR